MAGATPRVRLLLTPILKLVIAVIGLLILQLLVSALPMVREIPMPSGLPLPVLELVKVVIATVILVLLVNFAFEIEDNLEVSFPAFPQGGSSFGGLFSWSRSSLPMGRIASWQRPSWEPMSGCILWSSSALPSCR